MLETSFIVFLSFTFIFVGIFVHLKVMHLEYEAYKNFLETEEKYINDRILK